MRLAVAALFLSASFSFAEDKPAAAPDALQQALAAHTQGKRSEAIALYNDAAKADPKDSRAQVGLGVALYQLNRTTEALAAFHSAAALDPRDAFAKLLQCLAALKLGMKVEAADAYTDAVYLEPRYADDEFDPAKELFDRGFFPKDEKRSMLDSILLEEVKNEVLNERFDGWRRAHTLFAEGKAKEAETELRRIVKLSPDDARANLDLGQVLLYRHMHEEAPPLLDEALTALRRSIKIAPRDPEAHRLLGDALLAKHEFEYTDEIADAYGQAVELAPGNARYHASLGRALADLKRPPAFAELRRAIYLDSADYQTRLFLGELLIKDGKKLEALAVLRDVPDLAHAANDPASAEKARQLLTQLMPPK